MCLYLFGQWEELSKMKVFKYQPITHMKRLRWFCGLKKSFTYNTWGSSLKFFRTIAYQALCLKRNKDKIASKVACQRQQPPPSTICNFSTGHKLFFVCCKDSGSAIICAKVKYPIFGRNLCEPVIFLI